MSEAGPDEWFEGFFDHFPYEGEPDRFPAMNPNEISAVKEVCSLMQAAIADTAISRYPTVEEISRTGWPQRIAPVAKAAFELMLERGRFSEEIEEVEPSPPVPGPDNLLKEASPNVSHGSQRDLERLADFSP